MNILVTGAAGFIGYHLSKRLLKLGFRIIGVDNLNAYYDKKLKCDRITNIKENGFGFYEFDLVHKKKVFELFESIRPSVVIHLAAQPGVRYSLENPQAYIDSNITGFLNVLEACREYPVQHLIYASSSSVYGANIKMPFSVHDRVDHPVSLYAATKKSNELMAHTYSHLFEIPTTGLRFFTVYGPWGRPDMAYFSFTQNIIKGTPINVYNNGKMKRDFTYIDEIIDGIIKLIDKAPGMNSSWDRYNPDPATSYAPYRLVNIGNNRPVDLIHFINTLQQVIGKEAEIIFQPMQLGDVEETYADISDLKNLAGFEPKTSIEEGLIHFYNWYKNYYGVKM